VFYQVISMIGAALILVAYAGSQSGKMNRQDVSYNLLNLLGSGLLAWVAIVNRQAGFIILETVGGALDQAVVCQAGGGIKIRFIFIAEYAE